MIAASDERVCSDGGVRQPSPKTLSGGFRSPWIKKCVRINALFVANEKISHFLPMVVRGFVWTRV